MYRYIKLGLSFCYTYSNLNNFYQKWQIAGPPKVTLTFYDNTKLRYFMHLMKVLKELPAWWVSHLDLFITHHQH